MMRSLLVLAGLSCWALGLAACGDDTEAQAGGTDGSVEATVETGAGDGAPVDASTSDGPTPEASPVDGGAGVAFCDDTYGALRVAFEGCCTSGDVLTNQYKFIDAIYVALTQDCEARVSAAIDHGRVAFDPTAAQACVASIQQVIADGVCWGNISTNQPGPPPYGSSACSDVVTGLQANGAPCAVDFECQNGLTCVGWTGSTDGKCQTPGAAGKPCEQAPDAGSALDLDYGFGTHPPCAAGAYCVTPTCQPQAASGAACTSDGQCANGLTCHLGRCASMGPAGDGGACDTKVDCVQGLYCATGDGGSTGACMPREVAGGACTQSGDQCKGICVSPDGGQAGVCATLCGSG
jgi:hypothetical protein